jgi:hypothetical protein
MLNRPVPRSGHRGIVVWGGPVPHEKPPHPNSPLSVCVDPRALADIQQQACHVAPCCTGNGKLRCRAPVPAMFSGMAQTTSGTVCAHHGLICPQLMCLPAAWTIVMSHANCWHAQGATPTGRMPPLFHTPTHCTYQVCPVISHEQETSFLSLCASSAACL